MQPINQECLKDGHEYLIEYYGPQGLLSKMRGTLHDDGSFLYSFINVVEYRNGDEIPIIWFHTNRIRSSRDIFYWLFYIPVNKSLKRKHDLYKAKIEITKTVLLQQTFRSLTGDPSTVKGLIHGHHN
jgi:hypothetical protein